MTKATNNIQTTRKSLRQSLLKQRQALSAQEQTLASQQIARFLTQIIHDEGHKTVGLYLAMPGEVNLTPFIEQLWHLDKQVFVPVVDPKIAGKLHFLPYTSNTPLVPNHLGIKEPLFELEQACPLSQLDLLCTPLVGFDSQGQRLGMGGGFYDRALKTWYQGKQPNLHPVGIAHTCQHVTRIPTLSWDIPLPRIVTPEKVWRFNLPNV